MSIQVTQPFSQQDIQFFKDKFSQFDKNQNGTLEFEEFQNMFKYILESLDANQIQEGFKEIDVNQDGKVDFPEFLNYLTKLHNILNPVVTIEKNVIKEIQKVEVKQVEVKQQFNLNYVYDSNGQQTNLMVNKPYRIYCPANKLSIFVSNDRTNDKQGNDNWVEAREKYSDQKQRFQWQFQNEANLTYSLIDMDKKMTLFVSNDKYGNPPDHIVEARKSINDGRQLFKLVKSGNGYQLFNQFFKMYVFPSGDKFGNPPDNIVEAHANADNRNTLEFKTD